MKPLAWFPEPVPDWGSFTAQGLRGLLGRPRLHPLAILVRETAQNSWDARLPRKTVKFMISGIQFTDEQLLALSKEVFAKTPTSGLKLSTRLDSAGLCALIIRDTNTTGLGGPVRAGAAKDGKANRWVRFLLDIGVADRTNVDGGTYGFGRSITYNVSAVNTVLVYTRTSDELESTESRLIGSALGAPYTKNSKRYTGRHWWGRTVRDSIEPLRGVQADKVAAAVGFQPFGSGETGTAVMILDPILHTEDPEEAMGFIAESITWHLWPKMIPDNGRRPMAFTVSWNGKKIPVPDPSRLQPLPAYVRALQILRENHSEGTTPEGILVEKINSKLPKAHLGMLAVGKSAYVSSQQASQSLSEDGSEDITYASPFSTQSPFASQSHHVVLLRKPELVVTYREGPALANGEMQWVGVFRADDGQNMAFASAEPPTHDCWEPGTVEDGTQRRLVKAALREIDRSVARLYRPISESATPGDGQSVARIANALGGLLSGVPGQGGSVTIKNRAATGGGTGGNRGGPKVELENAMPVLLSDGSVASELLFRITPGSASPQTLVTVKLDVAVGERGTNEGENRPAGAAVPELLTLKGPSPVLVTDLNGAPLGDLAGKQIVELVITSAEETSWRVLAKSAPDTAIAFNVEAEYASAKESGRDQP